VRRSISQNFATLQEKATLKWKEGPVSVSTWPRLVSITRPICEICVAQPPNLPSLRGINRR
jgi:hypothetical protein